MSWSPAISVKRRALKLKQDFRYAACQYTELINSEQDRHTAWRAFKLLVPYKNDKKMWEHTKAKSFAALLAEALQDDGLLGTVKVRQDALAGYIRSAELADKIQALTGEVPLHRKLVHGLSSVADHEVLLAAAYRHAMVLLSDRPTMCKDKAARAGLDKAKAEAARAAAATATGDPGNAEVAAQAADQWAEAEDGFEAKVSKQDQDMSEPHATVLLQPAFDKTAAEKQKRGTLQQQLGAQEQRISELEQKCAELSQVNGEMSSQLAAALAEIGRMKAAASGPAAGS